MKRGKIAGALVLTACMLTGCADYMPDMTQEQTELVAEYAASLLLKYSSNYDYRIADEAEVEALAASEEAAEAETAAEEAAAVETIAEEAATEAEEPETGETQTLAESAEPVSADEIDIAAQLGLEGFDITYASMEVAETYPQTGADNGFSVTAPQGERLLLLYFTVENTTQETLECDLFDSISKVRVSTADSGYADALRTLLTDDFAMYLDDIAAGEAQDLVIVSEIDEAEASAPGTVTVRITAENGNTMEFRVD